MVVFEVKIPKFVKYLAGLLLIGLCACTGMGTSGPLGNQAQSDNQINPNPQMTPGFPEGQPGPDAKPGLDFVFFMGTYAILPNPEGKVRLGDPNIPLKISGNFRCSPSQYQSTLCRDGNILRILVLQEGPTGTYYIETKISAGADNTFGFSTPTEMSPNKDWSAIPLSFSLNNNLSYQPSHLDEVQAGTPPTAPMICQILGETLTCQGPTDWAPGKLVYHLDFVPLN